MSKGSVADSSEVVNGEGDAGNRLRLLTVVYSCFWEGPIPLRLCELSGQAHLSEKGGHFGDQG